MSPRAAARLASIGFTRVYDYVAGKADRGSAGLPLEGRSGSETRVGAYVRADLPVCRLEDDLDEVRRDGCIVAKRVTAQAVGPANRKSERTSWSSLTSGRFV